MQHPDGEKQEPVDIQEHMERLAPVLHSLPAGTQICFIEDGGELLLYDVNRAFQLIAGRDPTAVINIAERAKLIHPRGNGVPPEGKAQIDPEHATTVDLSYPVLILERLNELDGSPGRVIDGWHRIYRASQLGIAQLPAIVITADEEDVLRINRGISGE